MPPASGPISSNITTIDNIHHTHHPSDGIGPNVGVLGGGIGGCGGSGMFIFMPGSHVYYFIASLPILIIL
jgi:hypothetical protein